MTHEPQRVDGRSRQPREVWVGDGVPANHTLCLVRAATFLQVVKPGSEVRQRQSAANQVPTKRTIASRDGKEGTHRRHKNRYYSSIHENVPVVDSPTTNVCVYALRGRNSGVPCARTYAHTRRLLSMESCGSKNVSRMRARWNPPCECDARTIGESVPRRVFTWCRTLSQHEGERVATPTHIYLCTRTQPISYAHSTRPT